MRYFLEIAYKGTHYHGWQFQPNAISIQEVLEKHLSTLLKKNLKIVGAGRTDAGVHASQIFAHFDLDTKIDKSFFLHKINGLLPKEIVVLNLFKVQQEAHARFDAIDRTYNYHIFLGRNPFNEEISWNFFNKEFDVDLMSQASDLLLKTSNFKCFSRAHSDVKTFTCNVTKATWMKKGKELIFQITADRFLRNMVRAIVGTIIEVGSHKISLNDFQQILNSQNRCLAGPSAPSKGLFLSKVNYPSAIFLTD